MRKKLTNLLEEDLNQLELEQDPQIGVDTTGIVAPNSEDGDAAEVEETNELELESEEPDSDSGSDSDEFSGDDELLEEVTDDEEEVAVELLSLDVEDAGEAQIGVDATGIVSPNSEDGDAAEVEETNELEVEGFMLPNVAHYDFEIKKLQQQIIKTKKVLAAATTNKAKMNAELQLNSYNFTVRHYHHLIRIAYYTSQMKTDVINYQNIVEHKKLLIHLTHRDITINYYFRAYYDQQIRRKYATTAIQKAQSTLHQHAYIRAIRHHSEDKNVLIYNYNIGVNHRLTGRDDPTNKQHFIANIKKLQIYSRWATQRKHLWNLYYNLAIYQYRMVADPKKINAYKAAYTKTVAQIRAFNLVLQKLLKSASAIQVVKATGTQASSKVTAAPSLYAKNNHGAFFRWAGNSKVTEYVFEIRASTGQVVYQHTTTGTAAKVPLSVFNKGASFKVSVSHVSVIASYSSTYTK